MRSRKSNNKIIKLTAATALSSALVCSCGATRTASQADQEPATPQDSTEAFVPTHPPVVVPHSWREEMRRKQ